MAKIAVQPIVLRDCLATIGTDSYEAHVSGVTLTPASSTVNFNGLTPDAVFTFPTSTTWTVTLAYAQDWKTPNSLSRYLFEHEGEKVPMTFEPVSGGVGFTVEVHIAPGAIGGDVNSVATASVTLGVNGKPILVPAA